MTTKCSISDLPKNERAVLLVALEHFADQVRKARGLTREQAVESSINLFERGYLRAIDDGLGITFEPCFPEEAPQLRRVAA